MTTKTPGQLAYEENVRRTPLYHDGTPRPDWNGICKDSRWSWERNPTQPGDPSWRAEP